MPYGHKPLSLPPKATTTATREFLAVVTPGVLGPDFNEIAAVLGAAEDPPDPAAIGDVMRRHGLTLATANAARNREG